MIGERDREESQRTASKVPVLDLRAPNHTLLAEAHAEHGTSLEWDIDNFQDIKSVLVVVAPAAPIGSRGLLLPSGRIGGGHCPLH